MTYKQPISCRPWNVTHSNLQTDFKQFSSKKAHVEGKRNLLFSCQAGTVTNRAIWLVLSAIRIYIFSVRYIWEKIPSLHYIFVSSYFLRNKLYVEIVLTVFYSVFIAVIPFHRIAEIVTSSPVGMQLTNLSNHEGFYQRNVTWFPSQQQIGQQVFCFKAVDSAG